MNRNSFLSQLRAGLNGLPQQVADDLVRDYEFHFADGEADGRSDEDVASALGDPSRLAKELRAEFSLKRLDTKDSAINIAGALLALAWLATLDLFILLPLVVLLVIVALAVALALVIVALLGVTFLLSLPWETFGNIGEVIGQLADGAGLVAAAIGGGALLLIALEAGARGLGRYARLHYRLLQRRDGYGDAV